ncbi:MULTISPECIES: Arc family DNA-binding protein [unclassified Rhizobium]|uniref:Arc family DNA-binding protein n=1 Tax=unclassified Rhizobium TaxID=2613769 RepID=UPI001ADB324C|nr:MULTISPECIES: Arc family DNA-binding protein [unclassified Rhizobium]MBO9122784.1 Arc family DNA-binding protein [Rhizobium sp. 16-488-2b]MBO9173316.1 Arc family DNA-binding protein [Rhizobium sp. 16-488-2a]
MAKTERGSEQAMIRLPEGMRDKLKAAAEVTGRSMNAEIVDRLEQSFRSPLVLPEDLIDRITVYAKRHNRTVTDEVLRLLEREYPQQWNVDDRMEYLGTLLAVLQGGTSDTRINQFIIDVRDTVEGVIGGRVVGVSDKARAEIETMWTQYKEHLAEEEYEHQVNDLDEEEDRMLELVGTTEKLAEPLPDPRNDLFKLNDVLPSRLLAELTRRLTNGDNSGAADLLAGIEPNDLAKWNKEAKLSWFERERLRELQAEPSDLPFIHGPDLDDDLKD